jgi:hypothetical protein
MELFIETFTSTGNTNLLWIIQIEFFPSFLMFYAYPVIILSECVMEIRRVYLFISSVIYLTTLSVSETKYCQMDGRLMSKCCRRKASYSV